MHSSNQNSQWQFVFVLVSSWILGLAGLNFYTPAMPAISNTFINSDTAIKLTVSLFILGKGISMLLYSPWIESLPRKRFLLTGISIFAFGSLLALISTHIYMLLIGRLIQGVGVSLCILMGRALVNDYYKGETAAGVFSRIFALNSPVIILLPILGGYVVSFLSWRFIFAILIIYALINLILIHRYLPSGAEVKKKISLKQMGPVYINILSNRLFWGYVLILALMTASEKVFSTSSALLYVNKGELTKIEFGYLSAGTWLMHLAGLLICWQLAKRVRLSQILSIGIYLFVIPSIVLFISSLCQIESLWLLYLMMLMIMLSSGFILCSAAVGIAKPFPDTIALATALAMGIEFLLSFFASFVVSNFQADAILPISLTLSLLGIIAFMLWRGLLYQS